MTYKQKKEDEGREPEFCDGEDCPPEDVEDCPDLDDVEDMLTEIVSDRFASGKVWGEFFANMFQGKIDI